MQVSLDIETLGVSVDSTIATIGAVKFDSRDKLGEEFYVRIITDYGTVSKSTVKWWKDQPKESYNEIVCNPREPLNLALIKLVEFIGGCSVWGFGSDFDNVMVTYWCNNRGIAPWNHRQNRCLRTLAGLFDQNREFRPETPVTHHALDDAKQQAHWIRNICNSNGIPL